MLGEEYSMTSFFPAPEVLVPYDGFPVGLSYVRVCIWLRTSRMREAVLSWKCRNCLSWVIDETKSSGWN